LKRKKSARDCGRQWMMAVTVKGIGTGILGGKETMAGPKIANITREKNFLLG